jgi:2-polyprenyl-3-methyl-5-hydroxy-6-metoxy-1,4-benzoquinol methylase
MNDIAGREHWEGTWNEATIFPPANPKDPGWSNYNNRQIHKFISRNLSKECTTDKTLIELGCGNSVWLPYFTKEFNLTVWGLDYTANGCEMSREIMRRAGLPDHRIIKGDLFDHPYALLGPGRFDYVYSMGLVEHFADTVAAIRACAEYLLPRGLMITLIPNMTNIPGFIQRKLGKEIYDKHVPLDLPKLLEAHRDAGLEEVDAAYLGFFNFGLTRIQLYPQSVQQFMQKWGHRVSVGLGALHEAGLPLRPNQYTSPTIACIFRKQYEETKMSTEERIEIGVHPNAAPFISVDRG